MRLARVIALLLEYPTDELLAARAEIEAAARAAGRARGARQVTEYLRLTGAMDADELRRRYVEDIDFDARSSLHLTYHVHGDQRRRGAELIRLKERYAQAGLELGPREMPDHLAVLLEFVALAPDGEGRALLGELREPLELVRARLRERESPYALLLDAVLADLPRLSRQQAARVEAMAAEGPPTELVGLDEPGSTLAGPAGGGTQ